MKSSAALDSVDLQARLVQSIPQISQKLTQKQCVCLPDFFVDVLLFYPPSFSTSHFLETFQANIKGEGRNIYAEKGKIVPGGNAFNTACAIAQLGCPTKFIGETDRFSSLIATEVASDIPALEILLEISNRVNLTTSIEIQDDVGRAHNIMLSVADALSNWGPGELSSQNEVQIQNADLVYLSNWGINNFGNDLLSKVLEFATGSVMFDPGNIFAGEPRIGGLLELLQGVSVLSLNFDEFKFLERHAILLHSAESLNSFLENTLIFVHGHDKVRILQGREKATIPTFEIVPVLQTGLGDAFSAGVAVGILADLLPSKAALLGSAVAAYYSTSYAHPKLKDLHQLLHKEKLKSLK
ncbi:MAG: carbohydrate kinase family protein [Candidatus Hodarchaeales archaeon]|jgi:sugar/nucleoside kinase (ribokinase family)